MTHEEFLHILFENEIRWRSPTGHQRRVQYTGSGIDENDAVPRWMIHVLANHMIHYYAQASGPLAHGLFGFNLRPSVMRKRWDKMDTVPEENLDCVLDRPGPGGGILLTVRVLRLPRALLRSPDYKAYESVSFSGRQAWAAIGEHDQRITDRFYINTLSEGPVSRDSVGF